jgi:hypothetical protein
MLDSAIAPPMGCPDRVLLVGWPALCSDEALTKLVLGGNARLTRWGFRTEGSDEFALGIVRDTPGDTGCPPCIDDDAVFW